MKKLRIGNKYLLLSFCILFHFQILAKDNSKQRNEKSELNHFKKEVERLQYENEDAVLELQIKELQKEILEEQVKILSEEESIHSQDNNFYELFQRKKNRMNQNIFLPGLGTWSHGEKWKGVITMSTFGLLVFSTYTNYLHSLSIARHSDNLSYFGSPNGLFFFEQQRLDHDYRASYLRTTLFLFGTTRFYVLNLLESNAWEGNRYQPSPKYPTISLKINTSNFLVPDKSISFTWQFIF